MTNPNRNLRISDHDRQTAAERLRTAQNEGRLPVAEYDDRLGKVYQAATYGDLEMLFSDLPNAGPHSPAMMQPMMMQPMPPQQMMQPMTGPIAGPAAVVHNNIVVSGPTMLPSSGPATAGMVFGILSVCGFWIPFVDFGLSGLAIILSAIGLAQTSGNRLQGHGKAVTGLVLGIVGLLPAILFFSLVFAVASSTP